MEEQLKDELKDKLFQTIKLTTDLSKENCTYFFSDKFTDLQVGIYITDKIHIVFRGTNSIVDAKYDVNIDFVEVNCSYGIHKGVYTQLFKSNIYDQFYKKVLELISENNELEICVSGHSLGGALATLFGHTLAKTVSKQINIISFGSPKVGNKEWKDEFKRIKNLSHTRVFCNADPIVLFPLLGYKHVGASVELKSNSVFYSVSNHYSTTYKKILSK